MYNKQITYRKLRKYKYQLKDICEIQTEYRDKQCTNSFIQLTSAGLLIIQKGYAWDGPSGPTFDTKTFMRASLAHDALYQLIREGQLNNKEDRKKADKVLKDICIEDGMWKFRAGYAYIALRCFGAPSSKPDNTEEKVYKAP